MLTNQLTRQAFESDLHHITNNNWCGNVENILQILNKEENLRNHETTEIDYGTKSTRIHQLDPLHRRTDANCIHQKKTHQSHSNIA